MASPPTPINEIQMLSPRGIIHAKRNPKQEHICLLIRYTQVGIAFLLIISVATIFPKHKDSSNELAITTELGSDDSNFLLLLACSTFGLAAGLAYGQLRKNSNALPLKAEAGIDACFTIFYVAVGISTASSDYASNCDAYQRTTATGEQQQFINCGSLYAGIVFSFFLLTTFITSLGVTGHCIYQHRQESQRHAQHLEDEIHTPESPC